ncbi:hypothetical protein C2845_PM17G02090 [Panicum miliaceum]|uniref:F-box domain-containing protein n=1 Tax=Panicum miliaceum TaxID=4540 RepID=A0A3L6Q2W9_PANMI|nr:hypothetical protein C2845_PM17G02090 [Panicum miliaceum]
MAAGVGGDLGAMDAAAAGTATAIEDLPADVLALVLRRLDGASLAAVGCACSGLRGLAADPATWRALCLAMWPSVRDLAWCGGAGGGYRALFADAFPFPAAPAPSAAPRPLPARLVSARRGDGRRLVSVDRKWLTGDTVARFAVALGGGVALEAAIVCDERYGHVREVSLCAEDGSGGGVSGRDALAAVAAAMAGARRGGRGAEGEARLWYEEFVRGKRARKEWKARREGMLDLCCSGVGAAAFLGFLVMLTLR